MSPGPDGDELSFFTTYHVVSDSLDEAFDLAAAFEPEDIRGSLRLEEKEILSDATEVPTGVYDTTGYAFYAREAP